MPDTDTIEWGAQTLYDCYKRHNENEGREIDITYKVFLYNMIIAEAEAPE